MRDGRLNDLRLIAACCLVGFVVATSYHARGQSLPTNQHAEDASGTAVTLRYLEYSGDVAVFILNNGSERPMYLRVQAVPNTWKDWKKARAMYGIYSAEYKDPKTSSFVDASMIQDALPPMAAILPNSSLRFGISLRKGAGVYRVHVPYFDDPSIAQLAEQPGKTSHDDIERIGKSWKWVSSQETNIRCK